MPNSNENLNSLIDATYNKLEIPDGVNPFKKVRQTDTDKKMVTHKIFEGFHKECGKLEMCSYNETGCGSCLIRKTLFDAEKALEKETKKK